jgi:cellulose synthase/poly-beta-1,6-N-acetylglucosamine synthase-like glycosyltransferase/CheY-like chemotaxis protein
LVARADPVRRASTRELLERAQIDVVGVGDGTGAARALHRHQLNLIITDPDIIGPGGRSLIDTIRSDPVLDAIPLMVVTNSDRRAAVIDAFELGADDCIIEPLPDAELQARVRARVERFGGARPLPGGRTLLDPQSLTHELEREMTRAARSGKGGLISVIEIPSFDSVAMRLGERARRGAIEALAAELARQADPLDLIGITRNGDLTVLLPESDTVHGARRLQKLAARAAAFTIDIGEVTIRTVPLVGFARFENSTDADAQTLLMRAATACAEAATNQDLQPRLWVPGSDDGPVRGRHRKGDNNLPRDILQVAATLVIGIIAPFFVYALFDRIGLDITWPMYLIVVAGLVVTAALIWTEGMFALHPMEPPPAPEPEPPASAIICAYLPNEAATIVETLERFLEIDYPNRLQIILAYNTGETLPVEKTLLEMQEENPKLTVVKVAMSNSKAQNLNAALSLVTGEIVGIFDADHHPERQSFRRAWQWLSNGFDAVQGHCLVRNGDASFVARMVAVEFESIYAVSHPGRFLRDQFGIFGGSNGFWTLEALHRTRMRGSMLTEDIDASMRLLEAEGKIASDPKLISRELATVTIRQLWNQRLRWAQGWFQVSTKHLVRMLGMDHFSFRQKLGLFNLLLQRELHPWISLQIFPIVAYWIHRGDILDWTVPIFIATTIFTTSVGPMQVYLTWRLAHPDIKVHRRWMIQYLFVSVVYTEFKNTIARVSQLKQLLGETSWRVTPRSVDPA